MGQTQTAELLYLADQLEENLRRGLSDTDKHHDLCQRIVLAMRGAAPNIRKVSGERLYLGKFQLSDVIPFITKLGGDQEREYTCKEGNKYLVKMHSARYKMFLDNISCVRCGIVGDYFQLERMTDGVSHRAHFNLYGVHPVNDEHVMMTKDHILPRSKGGKDRLSNYQTMCSICNGAKGNDLEREVNFHIQKFNDWISPNGNWIVTTDKVSAYPYTYADAYRYEGRAINTKRGYFINWKKTMAGRICIEGELPRYIEKTIGDINHGKEVQAQI